jgi:ketosteroid isomerase-like protein
MTASSHRFPQCAVPIRHVTLHNHGVGRFLGFLAVTFTAMALTLAHAGDLGADTSKLLALENAWNMAQVQHDSKALEGLVSERFVYTDEDGTVMSKAQFLTDNKDPEYSVTLVTNDNMQVIAYSTVAIVIGKYHTKGSYKGKPFDHWGRFTDTWLYENHSWQCIATHTNSITSR